MLNRVEIKFNESNVNFDLIGHAVNDMISQKTDLLIIRNIADEFTCQKISTNFYNSPAARPRAENVPGLMVGESHYFKSPNKYYELCEKTKSDVNKLFHGASNPILSLYSGLSTASSLNVRAARFNNCESLFTRAIQWEPSKENIKNSKNQYMLKPHDDINQVYCERNKEWEIKNIESLIAVNFYAKTTKNEGSLRVFDFSPSNIYVENNPHLIGTGYPYTEKDLEGIPYVDVPVNHGDLILLNGKYVHGVTHGQGKRLVLNSFIGKLKSSKEVIFWT